MLWKVVAAIALVAIPLVVAIIKIGEPDEA